MAESRVRRQALLVGLVAIGIFTFVLVRTAWLSDDAYITFRSIHLLGAGLGPNFDAGERLQAFTHPLWYGLLAFLFYFTRELYYTTLVASIFLSVIAALLVLALQAPSPWRKVVGVGALPLSIAYVDYSTSGLENPLSHVVLLAFWLVVTSVTRERPRVRYVVIGFLLSLATLTRPDVLFLYGPVVSYELVSSEHRIPSIVQFVAGMVPLLLWESFSIVYYGFPLPNPAYAKLNLPFPRSVIVARGIHYGWATFIHDPFTIAVIFSAIAIGFLQTRRRYNALALGIVGYIAYVAWIGGDFMRGRFFTLPFLASVIMLVGLSTPFRIPHGKLVVVGFILVGLTVVVPNYAQGQRYGLAGQEQDPLGVGDERGFYYPHTGLMRAGRRGPPSNYWASIEGANARVASNSLEVRKSVGMFSFYAGRSVYVIDRYGITDPLLARLTPHVTEEWRVGHLWREIPPGYREPLQSGKNEIEDKDLAIYYSKLRLITHGDLFSQRRLLEIVRFDLGYYDRYRQAYEERRSKGLKRHAQQKYTPFL